MKEFFTGVDGEKLRESPQIGEYVKMVEKRIVADPPKYKPGYKVVLHEVPESYKGSCIYGVALAVFVLGWVAFFLFAPLPW